MIDNFSEMPEEKRLALLIAVNVRAENHHTLALRKEYDRTLKVNRKAEARHAVEKAKLLRQLAQYSVRTEFRQAFTARVRSLKSFLRGESTRHEVTEIWEENNTRFKDVLKSIKNKAAFMDIINRSQYEITLMGDTVYLIAKVRSKNQAALHY